MENTSTQERAANAGDTGANDCFAFGHSGFKTAPLSRGALGNDGDHDHSVSIDMDGEGEGAHGCEEELHDIPAVLPAVPSAPIHATSIVLSPPIDDIDNPRLIMDSLRQRSVQARYQLLEQMLQRPFPLLTEFHLIDKLNRISRPREDFVPLSDLIATAAAPESIGLARLGVLLNTAMSYGVVEKESNTSGVRGAYRITDRGQRYLEKAKHIRIKLWEINPGLSLDEVSAIIQLEGSDTIAEMMLTCYGSAADKPQRKRKRTRIKTAPAAPTVEGEQSVPDTAIVDSASTAQRNGHDANPSDDSLHASIDLRPGAQEPIASVDPLWSGLVKFANEWKFRTESQDRADK